MLLVDHAAHLPRLHPHQASPGDTALLLVSLSQAQERSGDGCQHAALRTGPDRMQEA